MSDTPMSDAIERHERLVEALVITDEQEHLYQTSALFRHSVELLTSMLPYWVNGLAAQAKTEDDRMRQAVINQVRRPPAFTFTYPADAFHPGEVPPIPTPDP